MWTYNPQNRCAGADFARSPIRLRSSCSPTVGFIIPRASLRPRSAFGGAPSLHGRYPASSLLRTPPPGSRLRRPSPFGSCGYLASAGFLDGARSPSLLQPMALCACCRLYPAERRSPVVVCGNRLLPSPILCRLGARGFLLSGPQPVVHHVVTARALASPPSGALSVGFARGISPAGATRAMRLRPLAASGLSPYGSMGTSRHHIISASAHSKRRFSTARTRSSTRP